MADISNLVDRIRTNYGTSNAVTLDNIFNPNTYSNTYSNNNTNTNNINTNIEGNTQPPVSQDPMAEYTVGLLPGMTEKDLGDGTYEILGTSGESYGLKYKDPLSAYHDIGYKNAVKGTKQDGDAWVNPLLHGMETVFADPSGGEWNKAELDKYYNEKTWYDAQEDKSNPFTSTSIYNGRTDLPNYGKDDSGNSRYTDAAGQEYTNREVDKIARLTSEQQVNDVLRHNYYEGGYGSEIGNWEALGRVLNGEAVAPKHDQGVLSSNAQVEGISGLNTLYGSTPVFKTKADGGYELSGYKVNLAPNEAKDITQGPDKTKQTGMGSSISHSGDSHSWNQANWRQIMNPEAYKGLATNLGNNNIYVTKDNAANLPGWANLDTAGHTDASNGFLGNVFNVLDPLLDTIDPMHNQVQTWTTGSSETGGQRPYFEKIAPMIIDAFLPGVGSAVGAVDSASKDQWDQAALSAAKSYLGVTGTNVPITDSNIVNAAITQGALSGAGSAVGGGSTSDSLKAALIGALTGAGGAAGGDKLLSGLGLDKTLSKMLYSGGTNTLGQLFRSGNVDAKKTAMAMGQSGLSNLFI